MRKLSAWLLLLAAVFTVGCGSDAEDFVFTNNPGPGPLGYLRFAHLSPDAPNVDIRINGQTVATNVPYETFSRYLAVNTGTQRIQILPTGTNNAVIDADVNVVANRFQTVAAVGRVATIAGAVYTDTVTNTTGNALVRTVHASPDAPAVDLTLADGTVLVSNLSFPNATDYASLTPGTYDLQLRVAGTDQVVRDFRGVNLAAGSTLSAVAVGLLSDQTLDVLVAVDDPNNGSAVLDLVESTSDFRVGHLAIDAGPVDVEVDGQILATNVAYPAVSGYFTTPSRDQVQVRILATGTENELLAATANLLPDEAYTVAATGSIVDSNIGITVYLDDRQGVAGSAQIRAVHASPDAPAVNVLVEAASIVDGIIFPAASTYVDIIPSAAATVFVNLTDDTNVITDPNNLFAEGETYSVFVIGRAGDPSLDLLVVQDS